MTEHRTRLALTGLQWVLGVVVIIESALFAFSAEAAHLFARIGLPPWVRPALCVVEMLAALLFLVPRTVVAGAYFLVAVFALAVVIHVLHGWYDVGALVVYAAAAIAVAAGKRGELI